MSILPFKVPFARMLGKRVISGVPAIAYFALICIFVISAASNGIPILRHDWGMPTTYSAEPAYFQAMYEDWFMYGMGAPHPYPTAFLLGFLGRLVVPLFSPFGLFITYLAAIALLIVASSVRLLRQLHVPFAAILIGTAFALFNPWVYTKLIAGHLVMISSYGAVIGIAAELLRSRPRTSILVFLTIVAMMQLQFALIVGTAIFLYFIFQRRWIASLTLLLVIAPSVLGILAYHNQLHGTPYLLQWQHDQSIAPDQALVFGGYFTHYADQMLTIAHIPMLLFPVLTLVSLLFAFRNRIIACTVPLTILTLLCVTGEKGPLSSAYLAIVTAIPETGVFRELYDLLAFAAAGYLVCFGFLSSRIRWLVALTAPAAIALLAAWVVYPPSAYWINANNLPSLKISPSGERFALFPAFQPLTFHGKGSGADPDTPPLFNTPLPLNEYIPEFPIDVALARYILHDNSNTLGALSVSMIYERPYLQSDTPALKQTISQTKNPLAFLNHPVKSLHIPAIPLASLASRLNIASVANDPSQTAVFVGDIPRTLLRRFGLSRTVSITQIPLQRALVNPNQSWVDARLAFISDPDLGQAFGGAYTQNTHASLLLPAEPRILAFIRGSLIAERSHWRAGTTHGYEWIEAPKDASTVTCLGSCAIALAGDIDPHMTRTGTPVDLLAVHSLRLAPWLIRVDIPQGVHRPLLRVNESFSPYWVAITHSLHTLPHVRVDTALNGYLDPPSETIYCIQVIALLQLVLELLAAFWCLALALYVILPRVLLRRRIPISTV